MTSVGTSGDWLLIGPADLPDLDKADANTILKLQADILGATLLRPGDFASVVVQALRSELKLAAATLYINCPELDAFKLKAAAGFEYVEYDSFLLPNPNYPSMACADPELPILLALPPFDSALYRDSRLLVDRDITGIVVVPLQTPKESANYPTPLGAICLYPGTSTDLGRLATIGLSLVKLIGTLYVAALERLLMDLRAKAVASAAFHNSLSDVCRRLLLLMQERLFFDAASVWLLNPRRELLYLRSSPFIQADGRRVMDHEIGLDKTSNPLVVSLLEKTTIHHPVAGGFRCRDRRYHEFDSKRILEKLPNDLHNGTISPLEPSKPVTLGNTKRDALGVIIILNKYSELGGVRHYLPMTWEDEKLLQFMSEVLSVLVFQSLRGVDHEADYERRIHGLKTNLPTVRAHLEQLDEREDLSSKVSLPFRHYISNCVEWVKELEQQVGRTDRIARLNVTPTSTLIYGEVVSKAISAAYNAARANDVKLVTDAKAISSAAHEIPAVRADPRGLLTVLRNLFENTIKYRDRELVECRVRLWYEVTESFDGRILLLHYQDNGIGICADERQKVFEDRYRGRVARRVHVLGEGIGLSECFDLMERMYGSIECTEPVDGKGAHFILRLQTASSTFRD